MKSNLSKLTMLDAFILAFGGAVVFFTLNQLFPEKKDL
jgi:hypothetical protein